MQELTLRTLSKKGLWAIWKFRNFEKNETTLLNEFRSTSNSYFGDARQTLNHLLHLILGMSQRVKKEALCKSIRSISNNSHRYYLKISLEKKILQSALCCTIFIWVIFENMHFSSLRRPCRYVGYFDYSVVTKTKGNSKMIQVQRSSKTITF